MCIKSACNQMSVRTEYVLIYRFDDAGGLLLIMSLVFWASSTALYSMFSTVQVVVQCSVPLSTASSLYFLQYSMYNGQKSVLLAQSLIK